MVVDCLEKSGDMSHGDMFRVSHLAWELQHFREMPAFSRIITFLKLFKWSAKTRKFFTCQVHAGMCAS